MPPPPWHKNITHSTSPAPRWQKWKKKTLPYQNNGATTKVHLCIFPKSKHPSSSHPPILPHGPLALSRAVSTLFVETFASQSKENRLLFCFRRNIRQAVYDKQHVNMLISFPKKARLRQTTLHQYNPRQVLQSGELHFPRKICLVEVVVPFNFEFTTKDWWHVQRVSSTRVTRKDWSWQVSTSKL